MDSKRGCRTDEILIGELFESDASSEILVDKAFDIYVKAQKERGGKPANKNLFGEMLLKVFGEQTVRKKRKVVNKGEARKGVYVGIASRVGLKKIVKTPLRDITNVHQVVDLKSVAGWWENFSAKSKELNGWQATLSAEVFVLCQTTLVCHNNFLVCKVITLKSNLSYQVKVGDHNCYVEGAPDRLHTIKDLSFIVSKVSRGKLCNGCANSDYVFLGEEVFENGCGKVLGRKRVVSHLGSTFIDFVSYFSVDCGVLCFDQGPSKSCKKCVEFDGVLRLRLFRHRSSENSHDNGKVNDRYLRRNETLDRLEMERQKRKNSEKREQYAKRRLLAEKSSKTMSENDHRDLSAIFQEVDEMPNFLKENPDVALFWNVQKEMIEKKTRNWHPRIIEVCLRLWHRSKQGYEELRNSGLVKLPSGRTLQLRKNSVKQKPGLNHQVLDAMQQAAAKQTLPVTGYHGFVVFDEMSIQGNLELKKSGDEFELSGLVDTGEFSDVLTSFSKDETANAVTVATHVLQFTFNSCEGSFQYPFSFYPTANLSGAEICDIYWDGIAALLQYGFNAAMGICDGGQSNRSFIMLHFESEEDAFRRKFVTTNPYNGEPHAFMMDPSHNFKKIRNNIEKSRSHGKSTRSLSLSDCKIVWEHWKEAYNYDRNVGIRTYHRLTDEHFELTPTSRMRNHLADDVLCPRMAEIMENYKNSLEAAGTNTSDIQMSLLFLDKMSTLLKNFKTRAVYKNLDDSRFFENEAVLHWLADWKEEVANTEGIAKTEKVLILMSTDYGTVKEGFELSYEASYCPRKCSGFGTCNNGKCSCPAFHKGEYCESEWCPSNCNQATSRGFCGSGLQRCQCNPGFAGEACSLSSQMNADLNSWQKLSSESSSFEPRSGHVAGYFNGSDTLWVHGGRSLNKVLDDISMYTISSNTWQSFTNAAYKPIGRFQHSGGIYDHYLVFFGGETSNGTILDDLWMFNTKLKVWDQPPNHDVNKPIGVVGHTVNIVGDKLYMFGGRTQSGDFSTDVYSFALKLSNGWNKLSSRGGKSSLYKLVGHSSVYNRYTNSLVFFGGEVASSSGYDSSKNNRLFSFNLQHHIWTELIPAQPSGFDKPLGLAFHSAVIAGDYMVVYGGVVQPKHYYDAKCHSNTLYYYNMKCNMWISVSSLTAKSPAAHLNSPPQAGRLSHVAMMRDEQTMLVVGGYNGVMFGDVLAYRMPQSVVFKNGTEIVEGQHCGLYEDKNPCYADPACGWCFSSLTCLALHNAIQCSGSFGSFDGRYCSSHCSAYTSCDSCLLFSNTSGQQCSWCVQDRKCYSAASPGGSCSLTAANVYKGWWGSTSKLLTSIEQCFSDDIPPGLTFTEYFAPANPNFPDNVRIISSAKVQDIPVLQKDKSADVKGFVYPYVLDADPTNSKARLVTLYVINSEVRLFMSPDHFASSKEEVAYLPNSNKFTQKIAKSPTLSRLFPSPSKFARYYIEMAMNMTKGSSNRQCVVYWNVTGHISTEIISSSFLHPYSHGNCNTYSTCMSCVADTVCGWCLGSSTCIARLSWSTCQASDSQSSYPVTDQSMCLRCTDYHDCMTCTKDPYCSWSSATRKCSRRGLNVPELTSSSQCPSTCASRLNCSSCLVDDCRWCHERQECFAASNHMMRYPLGQCQVYQIRTPSLGDKQCRNCSAHTNCTSCLADHRCGWCGNTDNPLIGRCSGGDHSGPINSLNCSVIMNTNETVAWSYDKCPDADECRLKIDKCDSNATCFNTDGSYHCTCNRGYTGDGKSKCEKTCYNNCNNGYCGADYQCKCNIGWKGVNCTEDCGCYGHSTCLTGIGNCDKCHNHTRGTHCDQCVEGSFGDAKTPAGCKMCQCNGHGDTTKGSCNMTSGKCYCKDHTTGYYCHQCAEGLAGDPRNGGICYHECSKNSLIKNTQSGFISSGVARTTCSWVISAVNASDYDILLHRNVSDNSTLITLTFTYLKLSCVDSHLYIYDGVPQGSRTTPLLAVVCGYDSSTIETITAKSGILAVYYEGVHSDPTKGRFFASFSMHKCFSNCTGNRFCMPKTGGESVCVCKPGWIGADCNQVKCPGNCSNATKQGHCNEVSGHCICNHGFTGVNCNETVSPDKFYVEDVSCKNYTKPRYGHTVLSVGNGSEALMFGGRGLGSLIYNDVWLLDPQANTCRKLLNGSKPAGRYYHCGIIYKDKMIIYGGITNNGVNNEFLSFDISSDTWNVVTIVPQLPSLYGHTCTIVKNTLYVIGGYNAAIGTLSEPTLAIDLTSYSWKKLDVNGFPIKGVYSHSAVYDATTDNILVFGGIAFHSEKIQQSNRLYSLDLKSMKWNYIQPTSGNQPFSLYMHSAAIIDNRMYVIAGYSDDPARGFNQDLLIWKTHCNHWIQVSLKDRSKIQGSQFLPTIGQSLIQINTTLYIYTGFNSKPNSKIIKLTLPRSLCSIFTDKVKCLAAKDCSWCNTTAENGVCYEFNRTKPSTCNVTKIDQQDKCIGNTSLTDKVKCVEVEGCSWCNTTAVCYEFNSTTPYTCNASSVKTNNLLAIHEGETCSANAVKSRPCRSFDSCVTCLASFPGGAQPRCHWCVGHGCNEHNQTCNLHVISETVVDRCLDRGCETPSCETCKNDSAACMWTRHFIYVSERGRSYTRNPGFSWNCFRQSLKGKIGHYKVHDAAPPNACPANCATRTSCLSCLSTSGSEGGSTHCYWSQRLELCFEPSKKYLTCLDGDCGSLLTDAGKCPAHCSDIKSCNGCLKSAACGWCAKPGITGEGTCDAGTSEGAQAGICNIENVNNTSKIWAPAICPLENECLNKKHNCVTHEDCIDQEIGFLCKCKQGYERNSTTKECDPICSQGCKQGKCISPDVCKCNFGWTSSNCSIQCKCNGYSDCPNATHAHICLSCRNNTQGVSCNECKAMYYGDPTRNIACKSCTSYCNGRSSVCVSSGTLSSISEHVQKNDSLLLEVVTKGPTNIFDIQCVNCQGHSEGSACDKCIVGYFQKDSICQECNCNGHAEFCDRKTGKDCKCQHNTASDNSCTKDCWNKQCNQCKDNFYGSPTSGHQCFKRMAREKTNVIGREMLILGSEPLIEPIPPNRTFFFAVPPQFTNLDIRLTIDIYKGAVDVYVATTDKVFVVETNFTSNDHSLLLRETTSRTKRSILDSSMVDETTIVDEYSDFNVYVEGDGRFRRSSPTVQPTKTAFPNHIVDAQGGELSMFTTFKTGLLLVQGIQRRVTIGIPYRYHKFGRDRFYVGVITRGNTESRDTAGVVYFKQELAQIDLFVFFSVFFSVFFLILSLFFLLWKIKQLHHGRQFVMQQQIAMETMASRPFSVYNMQIERNEPIRSFAKVHSKLLEQASVRNRRSQRGRQLTISPMAIEYTEDELAAIGTIFVQFPENEESMWNIALASGIVQANPQQLLHLTSSGSGTQKVTSTRYLSTVNV